MWICRGPTDFVSEPLCKTLSQFMVVNFHSWQVASTSTSFSLFQVLGQWGRFHDLWVQYLGTWNRLQSTQPLSHSNSTCLQKANSVHTHHVWLWEVTLFNISAKEKLTSKLVSSALRWSKQRPKSRSYGNKKLSNITVNRLSCTVLHTLEETGLDGSEPGTVNLLLSDFLDAELIC